MKPLKEKLSITLDADLAAALREFAELDGRSLSGYINIILRAHVNALKNKNDEKEKPTS